MAGQQTMSSQKVGLTGQKLHSLIIHWSRHSHTWKNNQILLAVNLRFCLHKNTIMLTDKKLCMNGNLFIPIWIFGLVRNETQLSKSFFSWLSCPTMCPKIIWSPVKSATVRATYLKKTAAIVRIRRGKTIKGCCMLQLYKLICTFVSLNFKCQAYLRFFISGV